MNGEETYKEIWEDYWRPFCTNEDGTLNLDQIQRELADYAFILEQVPSVYSEITGGTLSKPNYHAKTVIAVYEDNVNEIVKNHIEEIIDHIDDMKFGSQPFDELLQDVIEFLQEEYGLERR